MVFAGAAALVARPLAGDAVVDALATTESVRPAAEAAWSIGTSLLVQAASATLAYGVVIVVAAWLAGPTSWAVATRRGLAPWLREPRFAWGAFGVVVLVLLAWAPTPAFRQAITALMLIALLALGVAALRRQTAREYQDASRDSRSDACANGQAGSARVGGAPAVAPRPRRPRPLPSRR